MLPILYSYRRCPYAMRSRMALIDAGVEFEVREISLRNKPSSMLNISPKGTVPVLLLSDGSVLEQSLDIMLWAYQKKSVPNRVIWAENFDGIDVEMLTWLKLNDTVFKKILDAYKYPERFPTQLKEDNLNQALEVYLMPLEKKLSENEFLMGDQLSIVDIALFPFVRQFMRADEQKFIDLKLEAIDRWMNFFQTSEMFNKAMMKYPTWIES